MVKIHEKIRKSVRTVGKTIRLTIHSVVSVGTHFTQAEISRWRCSVHEN